MTLLERIQNFIRPVPLTSEQKIAKAMAEREAAYQKHISVSYNRFVDTTLPNLIASAIRKEALSHMKILYPSNEPWVNDDATVNKFIESLKDTPHHAEFSGPDWLDSDNQVVIYFFAGDKAWFERRKKLLQDIWNDERQAESEDEGSLDYGH